MDERSHVESHSIGSLASGNYMRFSGVIGRVRERGSNNYNLFHETFHFLGLSDRYYQQAGLGPSDVKGYEGDIMGIQRGAIPVINRSHYQSFIHRAQTSSMSAIFSRFINTTHIDVNRDGSLLHSPNYTFSDGYESNQIVPIE